MLYYLGNILSAYWGPARLFQSYAVLITVALYLGFQILGEFESNFRQFYSKDAFCIYDNYSIITMYIMLLTNELLMLDMLMLKQQLMKLQQLKPLMPQKLLI